MSDTCPRGCGWLREDAEEMLDLDSDPESDETGVNCDLCVLAWKAWARGEDA